MNTRQTMKSVCGISLIMGLLLLALLPSCGKKRTDSNVFVEQVPLVVRQRKLERVKERQITDHTDQE